MATAHDTVTQCSCCGEEHPDSAVHRLGLQPDAAICRGCAAWVADQRNRATPVLATRDMTESVRLWESAGFDVERHSEDFATAEGHGVELHITGPSREAQPGGACYLHLTDLDDVHATWAAAGLSVSDVVEQPWGMREFHVTDPGRNHIRVGQNL